MNSLFRRLARAWFLVPVVVLGFLGWVDLRRAERVLEVTRTDHEGAVPDAASPTGYAGGQRWLIVPEHHSRSYRWIAETQQMLAAGEWRLRHTDTENAPFGHDVCSASPYRWWLGLVAGIEHLVTGRSIGLAVEDAALLADPVLHGLLLLALAAFVARASGAFPAVILSVGAVTVFPLAGSFLPGAPDDASLTLGCALGSLLPLVACLGRPAPSSPALVVSAGILGGLGLWIDPTTQLPLLLGVFLGGLLASHLPGATPIAWRAWALAGALTSFAAYLAEYFPAHLDFQLRTNHPLHGLAWLGAGELLALHDGWARGGKSFWNFPRAARLAGALAAVAALPVAQRLTGVPYFLRDDLGASRLTSLPNGVVASSLAAWFGRNGFSGAGLATVLPLLALLPAIALLARRTTQPELRRALAVSLAPVLVLLAIAGRQLAWWSLLDAALLALSVPLLAAVTSARIRLGVAVGALFVFAAGVPSLLPPPGRGANLEFTRLEVEALVERGLAHWLADRAGPAANPIVLLPPDRTTSWCFHGGFRGLGTPDWQNRDGLAATIRIATATTAEAAQALLAERGVTHLVLPSWDPDLDEFARLALQNPEDAFVMALHHWALPPWLRPVPYRVPDVPGFEQQSVTILEVTNDTSRAAGLSRLAEYFVESGRGDLLESVESALARFPADLPALTALAQVQRARGEEAGFAQTIGVLEGSVAAGGDRVLAWDRRVSLAIVLALADRPDAARDQLQRCLAKLDEPRLRALTPGALFRLQVLARKFGLTIADPRLRELAPRLLPPELRHRLE